MSIQPVESIPADLRARNPLITPRAAGLLRAMNEHPDAPRWNYWCGDRITAEDLAAIEHFREGVFTRRVAGRDGPPAPAIVNALAASIPRVEWLRSRIAPETDLEKSWAALPTMTREDLALDMGYIMPDGCDLSQIMVYTTSGTTGHRLDVPNSPRGASSYLPLLEWAMAGHGVRETFSDERVGCFLLCAQKITISYSTVHAAWNNSGFAKVNLRAEDWPSAESMGRYLDEFQAPVLTGDPIAFLELRRLGIPLKPSVMLTTAMALTPGARALLETSFRCPVIDLYSMNETGPIAYTCPRRYFHVLPHDLHVETLAADGRPVATGARGEIAVSGGRNPFLPLFRYRTGDWARMDFSPCACGDPMPRLLDFQGRRPVLFRAADGRFVNTVDVSRVLHRYPLLQHRLLQRADGGCEVAVRPLPDAPANLEAAVESGLRELFGAVSMAVTIDPELGEKKAIPFESELDEGAR